MLVKTFVTLATLALASAGPVRRAKGPGCGTQPTKPTLPVNGNGVELSPPAENLVLKHIALGHGIQNYTCTANGSDIVAQATGALAALYDATSLYPNSGPGALPVDAFNALTTNAVWGTQLPLNSDGVSKFGASATSPFPNPGADLQLPNIKALPHIGVHFFDSNGVPTFKVGEDIFAGGKLEGIKAPASADVGPEKTGAVDWLLLGDKGASKGITTVYRVVTAGGVAHKCQTVGPSESVPYATYYWFFGPKA
ncbi:malate dehydrogenase [Colletotrichum truncatum]|uniref:Malate dehydrogenase n=1 Tax=Colletotrichum truncatum TaxID=5467 RepID=A0ACC3ZFT4_COLTU|nr:malate dehydrogenase [Colletotrichum truncatum]KAF6801789.1 malate dehydrogenase [Colletotrichum truncatum]